MSLLLFCVGLKGFESAKGQGILGIRFRRCRMAISLVGYCARNERTIPSLLRILEHLFEVGFRKLLVL